MSVASLYIPNTPVEFSLVRSIQVPDTPLRFAHSMVYQAGLAVEISVLILLKQCRQQIFNPV